jgi:diacylglycerol kinase (ATP)
VTEVETAPTLGRTGLLINAQARRGAMAEAAVLAALKRRGVSPSHVARVKRPRSLIQAVDALLALGIDRLIVGGGDGTLSTVASRLARRPVVLGVIPLGTANDFARTLGIPGDASLAAEIAAAGHVRRVDLARANDAYFLNVASLGMSVSATAGLSHEVKRRFGSIAYLFAGARAFVGHPTFRVLVQNGPDSIETTAHQIVVGNGRFYGGGVLVARRSTLEDGMLNAYALGTRGRWQLLRTVAMLRLGIPIDRPGDHFLQTTSLRVETWPPLRVNCDGEIRATTPVTFTVDPGALRVLAPVVIEAEL